eukprot:CAMPEP_0184658484 /NCGR_PEP_ID=MMETSP0308-20130426/25564_1 /TAXON_ID=38269 /ORGANISM="Gloeochaete witrockiana, Strain SAG 46.84" /LENGTH=294 /DNA_ID=CAMNT_0027097501 /DNA_START=96 /DNA_END=977 /DNA_ORIENTATION=+
MLSGRPLAGKVCLVTGASRGIGKGIALGLGEAGATVYITGRTSKSTSDEFPGTIVQTAEEVSSLGGKGIAIECDHKVDDQVQKVFERIVEEQGRLDILVNNVFAWDGLFVGAPFWEQGIKVWSDVIDVGLRSHYVASCFAAPIMTKQKSGLIVNVSSFGGLNRFIFNVAYGVGKAGVDRLAKDMAHDLYRYNVASISLWPGAVKTERLVREWARLKAVGRKEPFVLTEYPLFSGRAVAALAADKNIMRKTGDILLTAELAEEYGFRDQDDTQPASMRSMKYILPVILGVKLPKW